jgi:hypothetical protein
MSEVEYDHEHGQEVIRHENEAVAQTREDLAGGPTTSVRAVLSEHADYMLVPGPGVDSAMDVGHEQDLSQLTVAELRELADKRGVRLAANDTKREILDKLGG